MTRWIPVPLGANTFTLAHILGHTLENTCPLHSCCCPTNSISHTLLYTLYSSVLTRQLRRKQDCRAICSHWPTVLLTEGRVGYKPTNSPFMTRHSLQWNILCNFNNHISQVNKAQRAPATLSVWVLTFRDATGNRACPEIRNCKMSQRFGISLILWNFNNKVNKNFLVWGYGRFEHITSWRTPGTLSQAAFTGRRSLGITADLSQKSHWQIQKGLVADFTGYVSWGAL
jgi:hypothetical protein